MTQDEFAAKAGVGVRTLRDLERGRARPQRATKGPSTRLEARMVFTNS